MFVLNLLFQFKSKLARKLVTKVATKPEFLVANPEKINVTYIGTISVTISSPVTSPEYRLCFQSLVLY